MTLRLTEVRDSRPSTSDPPSETRVYAASGSNDESFVRATAITSTPLTLATTMGILHRQSIDVEPAGYEQWGVIVPYGTRERETGSWSWDFDTTGGTVHITTPIANRNRYPPGAPEEELIGFDGENVAGVDKVIPALQLSVTFKHPAGELNLARAKTIAGIMGTVNDSPMLTFAPGELLFLGARGSDGSKAEASVTYLFAASANVEGLTIGQILNVAKRGHDYLWVRFRKQEDGGKPVGEVEFVYVDQIYTESDHSSVLGFG